ncbi:MAG: SIS domain-containing protein [Thermomicrobiales bacterium]|nr:SIS domain-containing protein [Thermomicrobiales bacterium]
MATSRLQILPDPATLRLDDFAHRIAASLERREAALAAAIGALRSDPRPIAAAAGLMLKALERGGCVLTAGNGGSAAEAQHMAAELVGRFRRDRRALPALALSADAATLTAIANDYGYPEAFARIVRAWASPDNVLVLFSTSGESPNVLAAAAAAHSAAMPVVAVTGGPRSRLAAAGDVAVRVPAVETPLIQELHAIVVHLVCDLVEAEIAGGAS